MTSSRLNSFLRESGKLYALYMAAGVASIPAGVLYAILAVNGYRGWWSALLAIALGFLMAKQAWSYVQRAFFTPDFTASGASITWSFQPMPAAVAVAFMLSLPSLGHLAGHCPMIPHKPTGAGAGTVVTIPPGQTDQSVPTFEFGG